MSCRARNRVSRGHQWKVLKCPCPYPCPCLCKCPYPYPCPWKCPCPWKSAPDLRCPWTSAIESKCPCPRGLAASLDRYPARLGKCPCPPEPPYQSLTLALPRTRSFPLRAG